MTAPEIPPQIQSGVDAEQIKVFRSITFDYFNKIAPDTEDLEVGDAFLKFDEPMLLDYTSAVFISGDYEGAIYLTVPGAMIEQLLQLHHETEISDRTRADMCRELSNVLSGNASRAFGSGWNISVPQSVVPGDGDSLVLPEATFIMPAKWKGFDWFLVLGLKETVKEAA